MQDTMTIATESGFEIHVAKSILDGIAEIILRVNGHRNCLLHWGLRTSPFTPWLVPPRASQPEGSKLFDHSAVRTPFMLQHDHEEIIFKIDLSMKFLLLEFVLFFPKENHWDNNRGTQLQDRNSIERNTDVGSADFGRGRT